MSIERLEQIKNVNNRNLVKLLQDLVQIPSWVPSEDKLKSKQNENEVVDYIENWVRKNTNMEIQRQSLDFGRSNLIISRGKPDLVFLAHTDTVQPSEDAPYDQLAAEIHGGKIWGRGTTDMKSGIATMIQALSLVPDADNIWTFLYADEEYDFLGMKAIVRDYSNLKPKLIVSSDGSDLSFGHGCRGLIEIRGRFTGQTGHPARGTGKSATMRGWNSLVDLQEYADGYVHPVMGKTSFNVSHVLGGAKLPNSFDENGRLARVGQAGNVVSDIMEFVVDIRPSSPDLSTIKIISKLQKIAKDKDLGFEVIEKTHALGAWYTKLESVDKFIDIAKNVPGMADVQINDPGKSGYLDLQMLWEATGKPPAFMFGGGNGDTAHTPEEHIEIDDLVKTRDFFVQVLKKYSIK